MRKVLAATSWDRTVHDMEQVLCEVECAFAHRGRSTELADSAGSSRGKSDAARTQVLVAGAGPTA
jgi:hypothetical protein